MEQTPQTRHRRAEKYRESENEERTEGAASVQPSASEYAAVRRRRAAYAGQPEEAPERTQRGEMPDAQTVGSSKGTAAGGTQSTAAPIRTPAVQEVRVESPMLPRALRKSAEEAAPPEGMARSRPPQRPQKPVRTASGKAYARLPMGLAVGLIAAVLAIGALFTAQALMQAYLTRRQAEREAAYQAVVDAHPMDYRALIEQYASENNLRPSFVAAIILNESSFRTKAESNVGARGLMQLMPDTAEWIAGKLDVSDYSFERMYDGESNIRFGTWYLGYLSRLFGGDPVLVACAYHAGQGEVTGWLSDKSLSADGVTLDLDKLNDGPTKSYAGRVTRDDGIYQALYFTQETGGADLDADAADGGASDAG